MFVIPRAELVVALGVRPDLCRRFVRICAITIIVHPCTGDGLPGGSVGDNTRYGHVRRFTGKFHPERDDQDQAGYTYRT